MLKILLGGYAMSVLIDTSAEVAIDVGAGTARLVAEMDVGRVMLVRAGDRFGYSPKRVAADAAFT